MKKIFTGLFIILFHVSGHSHEAYSDQNPNRNSQIQPVKADTIIGKKYSRDNLRQTSAEELNLYFKKAKGLKTTGIAATVAGPVLLVIGTVLTVGWRDSGPPVFWTGFIATVAGVPILITGSRRVNKTKEEIYYRDRIGFNISPGVVYSSYDQNPYPGITIKLRF